MLLAASILGKNAFNNEANIFLVFGKNWKLGTKKIDDNPKPIHHNFEWEVRRLPSTAQTEGQLQGASRP